MGVGPELRGVGTLERWQLLVPVAEEPASV